MIDKISQSPVASHPDGRTLNELVQENPNFELLVAEDDPEIRNLLATLLGNMGIKEDSIHLACDGREALDILKEDKRNGIKLAFVDLHMPRLDGFELIKLVEQNRDDITIVVCSGSDTIRETNTFLKHLDALPKPFRINQIEEAVKRSILQAWN